ncbi:MAG: alpha/beta fold hydrolase [Clostridia bacterium]|nr:alpha/beta fold hydrolase [Clostridia bacterium]
MAMLVDLPIEKLELYTGRNPRPDDFDEYWKTALCELDTIDAGVEIKEADFRAPGVACYDLYFTGAHGARIHAKYARPKQTKGKMPAVLMFHGYFGASPGWIGSILSYALAGFSVFAMDCRGQGGKSEDVGGVVGNTVHGHIIRGLDCEDPHKLLYRDIFLDAALLARIAMGMDDVDETRVGVMGKSQGGALSIACAALEPRVRLVCAEYPFLSDYRRVWEMDLAKAAYEELSDYFRRYDPRHEREDAVFTKLGYIDIQNLAPRVRGEVVMFTGLMDTVVPPSTQFAAYNKLTCKKRVILYPDFGHEVLPDVPEITYGLMLEMAGIDPENE